MATPPRVPQDQYETALARIIRRHRQTDFPDQHLLSDDPREVLSYLRKRRYTELLEDDDSHDLEDAMTLKLWLWWESEATELRLLEAAEVLKLRGRVTAVLGISSNPGGLDRLTRKRALFKRQAGEDERRTLPEIGDVGPLRQLVARLLDLRDGMPDDPGDEVGPAEEIGYLRSEATAARAEMAYPELRNALRPIVADLLTRPVDGQLRAVLEEGAELLSD